MKNYELWYTGEPPFGEENVALYNIETCDIPDNGWEKWSLPIGNGYMGVNVFGRTATERLQITENSLSNPAVWDYADRCNAGLNNFCELYIDFGHNFSEVKNYRRSLNLNTAVAKTEYTLGGIRYTREYFTTYADRVLAVRLTADKKGALTFTVRPEVPFICDYLLREGDGMGKSGTVSADGDTVTFSGEMHYYAIKFEGQVAVIPTGGTIRTTERTVEVSDADSAVILVAVGTNYRMESRVFTEPNPKLKLAPYPHPHDMVTEILKKARYFSYGELLERHINDYKSLFDRARVDFGGEPSDLPTNELLDRYKAGERSAYLEELYFSYGRYLLISSSRVGSYPANLQGTWNQYASSPWTSGYWHNINVQMNYWPAFNTNLHELFVPYIDYFSAFKPQIMKIARHYVSKYFPENYSDASDDCGITIGTGEYLYRVDGPSAPGRGHSGPGTVAFTAKLFTDYCEFKAGDTEAARLAFNVNLSAARFLSKVMEEQDDGTLLVKYSASPEQKHNGENYHTKGCAFDQQMVYECYKDTVTLADKLGESDEFIEKLRADLPRLDPVQVGKSGQIKEYREEQYYGDIGEEHHRHISHLVGLYPGTLINGNTPEWLKAAEVSLNRRGDESTGWSTAHKLNAWARTKNGNRAYDLLKTILVRCTLPNLWDTHPPFQIDGNLGATAGIAEMLLQSHEGYLHILPALPDIWESGSFTGLTSRGGYTVSAEWKNRRITRLSLTSETGGEVKLFVGSEYDVCGARGGFISRNVSAGETLSISF